MVIDIWKKGTIIIDDDRQKRTCELMLIDKTTGKEIKRYVEIKDGEVIEKPDDVDIIGHYTPVGFVLRGMKLKSD